MLTFHKNKKPIAVYPCEGRVKVKFEKIKKYLVKNNKVGIFKNSDLSDEYIMRLVKQEMVSHQWPSYALNFIYSVLLGKNTQIPTNYNSPTAIARSSRYWNDYRRLVYGISILPESTDVEVRLAYKKIKSLYNKNNTGYRYGWIERGWAELSNLPDIDYGENMAWKSREKIIYIPPTCSVQSVLIHFRIANKIYRNAGLKCRTGKQDGIADLQWEYKFVKRRWQMTNTQIRKLFSQNFGLDYSKAEFEKLFVCGQNRKLIKRKKS